MYICNAKFVPRTKNSSVYTLQDAIHATTRYSTTRFEISLHVTFYTLLHATFYTLLHATFYTLLHATITLHAPIRYCMLHQTRYCILLATVRYILQATARYTHATFSHMLLYCTLHTRTLHDNSQ